MRVRISYVVEVSDFLRRAIVLYQHGGNGTRRATRDEVKSWYETHGGTMDDDVIFGLQLHEQEGSTDNTEG